MYIVTHSPTHVGEIIRAYTKEKAISYANKFGRMEGEPIWRLRKYSYRASKSQEKKFSKHKDTAWAK